MKIHLFEQNYDYDYFTIIKLFFKLENLLLKVIKRK